MNISELSIRHHVFTWMLMFGLIFFGLIAYSNAWNLGRFIRAETNPGFRIKDYK